jgi:hypothetical protein
MSSEYLKSILQEHQAGIATEAPEKPVRKADKSDSTLRWKDEVSGLFWPYSVEGRDGQWMKPNSTGNGWVKASAEETPAENLKFIQTEPTEKAAQGFEVGLKTKDHGGALPRPQWKRPGEPATEDEIIEYERAMTVWAVANTKLELYLRFLNRAEPTQEEIKEWYGGTDWPKEQAEIAITWLQGIWSARGIDRPANDALLRMAAELRARDEQEEAGFKARHAEQLKRGEVIQ